MIRQGHITGPAPFCPLCRVKLDGWTAFRHEDAPRNGDATICFYCRAPLIFQVGAETVLREPNEAEIADLLALPEFAAAGRALNGRRPQ